MSQISATATQEVFKQEGGGFIVRLVIAHSSLATPLRFCNNNVNIVSGGNTYIAYPFDVRWPDQKTGAPMRAQLIIDNVTREIAQIIRSIVTPPTVTISAVRISNVNAVEVTLPAFELRNVEWDAMSVTGDLTLDNPSREVFPQRSMTPAEYPGIF